MMKFTSAEMAAHEIEHNNIVRKNAAECTLFLKRNADLPIKEPCKVNLYGSGARSTIKGGKGSGDVNTRYNVSIEEGLQNAGFQIRTRSWMDEYDALVDRSVQNYWTRLIEDAEEMGTSPYVLLMERPKPPVSYDMSTSGDGELNIYVVARDTSEGFDRLNIKGDFKLLDCEIKDILELASRKEKFLLVLNCANVLDISEIVDKVDNILLLGQLGAETGNIFADILMGKSCPSGKLSTTWGKCLEDYPSTKNFGSKNEVKYEEGVYVGYRYFTTFAKQTQFPFGYGLGYTDFEIRPLSAVANGNILEIKVKVKNIGEFIGKETVQIYASMPEKINVPHRRLVSYSKTDYIPPKESREVTLSVDMMQLACFDEKENAWQIEEGCYQLHIGNSVENTACALTLNVKNTITLERTHKLSSGTLTELSSTESVKKEISLLGEIDVELTPPDKKINKERAISPEIKQMTNEQLARLCVGVLNDMTLQNNIGNSGKLVAGSAGETFSNDRIKPLVLADGTAGLRISPTYQTDERGRVKSSRNAMAGLLPGGVPDPKEQVVEGQTYYQYCTAIPVGTALAQSWNSELCEQMGEIVGSEMELFGVDFWLAPAMNIHRNPLCGRSFEYYSEDPLLSGKIAASVVRGVQKHNGRYVTVKHFCANNQETDRFFCNSILTPRALREIYLRGFEICIKESAPGCIMTSYNLLNGVHTANSKELLLDVLRDEWNYDGLIVTDWLATGGMGCGEMHGPATARGCIAAGNDLIMPGRDEDIEDILQGIKSGEVKREELEKCADRILHLADKK